MAKRKAKGIAMEPRSLQQKKKNTLKRKRTNATWDPRQVKLRTTTESHLKSPSRFQVTKEKAILKTEHSSNDITNCLSI